ncbi:uncharacterized protein LOC116306679 [Actinia tenebrosa]|uniref:Uncharacterized protein LOC116306679 n=1 Tax=Actinia tenebrosa TaxID=6105 RepID=A0A6P8J3M2_ACTTE|nr:uncharacterized protein LOC116306679 [Actinia tenebrosa]XP_031572618.1 uncharacterized protein LOC116306679 [Actinia tenebrosa]XP_031572620.1 uncharacterized protein LOC116306679 [Actinia tenebrosa]XP_031572621.1 uncharacterized protein LOC116306679 [Actinia tenebrosa]
MMRLKSQSLPETENTKVEFGLVAEGNLNSLNPNRLSMQRSNSALPQSSKEMRTAGKNAEEKKAKAGKRWKVLRLLTLVAKRNKNGRKRTDSTKTIDASEDSFSPLNDQEFSFDGASSVKEITITKPEEDRDQESESNVKRQESTSSDKRIMWDEESIVESPSRKISEGQYMISNTALATAVGKWKESIRPNAPELYESGKGVPRRLGVCEELEKAVVNDGTSLHELRKDLTVYLTLDELGML